MDSLTHIVLGAAIGEAVLGKKIGRKAMLVGALADTIPDFDVFASPCFTDAQQLLVHRGITHSIFFAVLMAPLLGVLFSKLFRKTEVSWKSWTFLFFLGMFTHILIDSFTSYGTGWFEPFSSYRVSLNTIFVADPFYTIPFLICVLIALIAKNGSPRRIKWNKIGLWISSLYLLFTFINKWHVHDVMKTSFEEKKYNYDDFITTPTPLNNFLWMSYSHDSLGSWIGYYSIFDKSKKIDFKRVDRNDSLLIPLKGDENVKILKQFSKGHYAITKVDSTIYFNDLRFGQVGGWDDSDPSFPLAYRLNNNADNSMVLDRGKFKVPISEAFKSLVKRAKGK
ncbi:MAG TPA: metal-dependent hydrolase [Bacteroidia bacterium]|nr:metal-dependent hydrolase [Bacteroidia bacterium]